MNTPRSVSSTIDIWSFGCVLSEAIIWLVGGMRTLNLYRNERHQEARQLQIRDVRAFHDGLEVCVM